MDKGHPGCRAQTLRIEVCAGILATLLATSCQRASVQTTLDEFPILTPPTPATPQIHGTKVVGARPGAPFLFQISATGERPMTYGADNLPAGLKVDSTNGQIVGAISNRGRSSVLLRAENSRGSSERALAIVVGGGSRSVRKE